MQSNISRRDFIHMGTGTLVSAGLFSSMAGFQSALAATTNTQGYKALVCLFLVGGNDALNWLVPLSNAGYSSYAQARGNIALPQSTPLALNGTASDGYTYGIHSGCPELQALFNASGSNLAFINNVGTLVKPTAKSDVQSGAAVLPPQLFSHIDQQIQWMTSIPNSQQRFGWAGRIADLYASNGYTPKLAMNINVGGVNYWQSGQNSIPYVLGPNGAPVLNNINNTGYRNGLRASTVAALYSQAASDPNLLVNQYAAIQSSAASKVAIVNSAFATAGDLQTPFPGYDSDSGLGAQLHEVARCIKAQSQLGDARQIFYVQMLGFDTHNGVIGTQNTLMPILSKNINTFWNAMKEIQMQNNVTLFTASDFGRSMGSNGDGSDHAWGSHHLLLGGAVNGGKFYGKMPTVQIGGPDDYGSGQIIPTMATDQYAARLAQWFGVGQSDLNTLFPNLANFDSTVLQSLLTS